MTQSREYLTRQPLAHKCCVNTQTKTPWSKTCFYALQWWPCRGNVIKSGQFIQLLRKRFAIPCLLPPDDDDYACSCGGRRVAATLKNDPCHALHCKLQRVPGLDIMEVGHPKHAARTNPQRAGD